MLTHEKVEFQSEGAVLRGCLLRDSGSAGALPAIVMAHGTSATVLMVAIEYARAFASKGFAVLVYDHRNFGRSGGEPPRRRNGPLRLRGHPGPLTR